MAFNFLKGFQDSAIFKCGFFRDNTFYASAYPNGFGILRASVFGYGQTAPHLLKIRKKHQVLSLCRNKTAVWIMVEDTLAELWSSEGVRIQRLAGHPNTVRKAISHDLTGNTLTLAGNEWFLWDLTGAQIANFPHPFPDRPNAQVADGAFSDDGSRILITYFYASPQLFDQSGKLIAGLKGHEIDLGRVAAAFVPGTNQILTVDDSRFRLWDAAGKGEMLFERNKTSETPRRILFAPDGSRFLLIFDNLTELWTAQADSLASFPSNQMFYENFAFSPSGDYFFLPEYAGRWGDPNITPKKIIVLDRNGNRVAEIGSGEQEIKKAMFSPDGKAVYTLTSDGVIRNWPLPEAILDWLDSNPVLPLSDKEKREFGITN
jgi:WD40 repeat protein